MYVYAYIHVRICMCLSIYICLYIGDLQHDEEQEALLLDVQRFERCREIYAVCMLAYICIYIYAYTYTYA